MNKKNLAANCGGCFASANHLAREPFARTKALFLDLLSAIANSYGAVLKRV